MTLSTKQLNTRAADLLEGIAFAFLIPKAWARGTEARDGAGNEVCFDSPKATCFCALGALAAAKQDLNMSATVHDRARTALQQEIQRNPRLLNTTIAGFNDSSREKYRVVEAFQAAADRLRA